MEELEELELGPKRMIRADSIIKTWKSFSGIYKSKRYIIENRWMKLKSDRKKKLLGECWPEMPDDHRPDLNGPASWRLKGQKAMTWPYPPVNQPEYMDLFLPDFNKEDLGENNISLLQVLETRANLQPGHFGRLDANYDFFNTGLRDYYSLRTPWPEEWDEELKGTHFVYTGPVAENNLEEYGAKSKLKGADQFRTVKCSNYSNLPDGARTMWTQEAIYTFLERLCRTLTDESNHKTFTVKGETNQTLWKPVPIFDPQGPEQETQQEQGLESWSNLANFYKPDEVDWDHLSVLSGSRLRNAQQALRDMKEDPEYFFLRLVEMREHAPEMVLFPGNEKHPWKGVENNPEPWASAFKRIFADTAWSCDFWQSALTYVEKLRQISKESKMTQGELCTAEGEYRSHFLTLMANTVRVVTVTSKLIFRLKCMENARHLYRIDPSAEAEYLVPGQGARKPANATERALTTMLTALRHKDATKLFGRFSIIDELNRLIPRSYMSDFAMEALDESMDCILMFSHLYRAWDSATRYIVLGETDQVPAHDARLDLFNQKLSFSPGSPIERVFHGIMTTTDSSSGAQKLGSLRNKFRHSKKAKMSKAERASSIEAEANLKRFWEAAERVLDEKGLLSDDVKAILADCEPWTTNPDPKAAGGSGPAKPAAPAQAPGPFVPLPAAQPGDLVARKVPRTLIDLQADARKRVVAIEDDDGDAPVDAPKPEEGTQWPKIVLSADNYTVLEYLLGTSSKARPGEIEWNDIVRLLNAIGFAGPKMHPGSARFFIPGEALRKNQGISENIGLHEPHQKNSMPLIVARTWARHRSHGFAKYGWDFDHFVEEGAE